MSATAPFSSPSSLTEVLKNLIEVRHTGYLKIKEGEHDGCIALENGIILYARADTATGLPALFQFVAWRDARFEFQERPLRGDISRDLAAYDPQVLLTGVAFKVEEQNLLLASIPALDDVVRYVGGDGLASVEITPHDLMLLSLADGHRTVREIGERTGLGATEAAKHLSRFRMAGVVVVVNPHGGKPARLAAAS